MKTEELRKVQEYVDKADELTLINILSFVEEDPEPYIVENKYDHWKDEEFVKEMDRRMEELESGKVQGIPWEEVHKKALENLNKMKKKNG